MSVTKTTEIREAFSVLRELCDPRGHGVLDALEQLCLVESMSLDVVLRVVAETPVSEVSNVIPLFSDRHSVKA